jgi:hypothetical protein
MAAAAAAPGVPGWGIDPSLPGAWESNLTPFYRQPDVVTQRLQLVFGADGSAAVRFALDDQSLASQGGTGCERIDSWIWNSGNVTVNGQTLQFNVSGTYNLAYPQGWVSPDCNPSLNSSSPIADTIVFTPCQVVGGVLNVGVPTGWGAGSKFNLPTNVALYWSAQDSVGTATWSPWETLGGYCIDGVAVSSWGPGRLDVFAVGGDMATYHNAWDGAAWTGWNSLGGGCASAPAAVSWGPNRIDVFVIGNNHNLYHQWWDGSAWSGWKENLGGYCVYGVAAVSQGPGLLDVFVISRDSAVWRRAFNGSAWGVWDRVGGYCVSAPAASCPAGTNWIDLYVIGEDHAVYHNPWHDGAWHGWFSLGGYGTYGVAATTWSDVYTIGSNGQMYRNYWTGSVWAGWASLGGGCHSAPAAVAWSPAHLDVLVIGPDNACWHKWYG